MTDDTCNATNRNGDPCALAAGWGTDHVGEGRCKLHGGVHADHAGENNPNYSHGLFDESGVDDDDLDTIDELAGIDNLDKHDMLIDFEMMRFLRATGLVDDPAWTPDYNADGIEIGESVDMNDGPLAKRAGLISSLLDDRSKAEHRLAKIDEGEKHRVEQSVDDDTQNDVLDAIDALQD
jgi:hypothetical protein